MAGGNLSPTSWKILLNYFYHWYQLYLISFTLKLMRFKIWILLLLLAQADQLPWLDPSQIKLPNAVFPSTVHMSWMSPAEVKLNYTFNNKLTSFVNDIQTRYRPDYSGVVLMDAQTGQVLVNQFYVKDKKDKFDYQTPYISASLFKVITAAAAVNEHLLEPSSRIDHTGRAYDLKRYQLKENLRPRRWVRTYTLEQALAKSINAVFGRIGVHHLGPELLTKYAIKAGFHKPLSEQVNLSKSEIHSPNSTMETARLASGYGHLAKISPIHASIIAASMINGGVLPSPQIISSVEWNGSKYFQPAQQGRQFISKQSAQTLSQMLSKTVKSGTARGAI